MNYKDFGKTPTSKSGSAGSFIGTLAFGAAFLPFMPIVGAVLLGIFCVMVVAPKKHVTRSH